MLGSGRALGSLPSADLARWAEDLYLADDTDQPLRGAVFAIEQLELHARGLAATHRLGHRRGGNQLLERLAEVSGGRAFSTDDERRLDRAFAEIIEDLSNQYLLAYPPKNPVRDGAWRRIRVEVGGRGNRVRARQGYRAIQPD